MKLASKVEGVKAKKSWLLSTAVSILVVLRIDIFTRTAVLAEMKLLEMSTAPEKYEGVWRRWFSRTREPHAI